MVVTVELKEKRELRTELMLKLLEVLPKGRYFQQQILILLQVVALMRKMDLEPKSLILRLLRCIQ